MAGNNPERQLDWEPRPGGEAPMDHGPICIRAKRRTVTFSRRPVCVLANPLAINRERSEDVKPCLFSDPALAWGLINGARKQGLPQYAWIVDAGAEIYATKQGSVADYHGYDFARNDPNVRNHLGRAAPMELA